MGMLENLISEHKFYFSLSVMMDRDLSVSPWALKVTFAFGVVSLYGWQETNHHNFGASYQLSIVGHTTCPRLAQN